MKKLYLFLFSVLCFAFVSKADRTYTFKITVEEPKYVTIKICDYYDASKVLQEIDVVEGLNEFEFTSTDGANMFINTVEGRVLKVHKADGSVNYDVKNNELKEYLSPYNWGWGDSNNEFVYTIKTFDEATFRPNTVKVTIDNPTGIRMTLRGGNVINTDTTEYNIPFNADYEDMLTIRKEDTEELIYKITANGEEVFKDKLEYNIPLVDRSDVDDIKYITDVVITQDFPEGVVYTVKFVFTNGDPGCVKSVTYGDEPIEDFAAEEGFKVRPGKKLVANFNRDDYRMVSYQKNDADPYESDYISLVSETIGADFTLTVTAIKYTYVDGVIVVDDPNALKITKYDYPYTQLELVEGENPVSFKNDGNDQRFNVTALDGYEILRLYDATYDKETTVSTWSTSTAISLQENSKFEITTGKIVRDMNIVFYADDITDLWYGLQLTRGGFTFNPTPGYTVIDYREKDSKVTVSATGALSDRTKYYRNGKEVETSYYSYYSFENLQDNDVIKLFFNTENAIEHTVTFEMNEGTLDGYEVKKDILAAVDPTEPVSAIGKTQFTIAPVAREGSDLTVTIGDKTIEPVDGVYTFETEGDTTVKVSNPTSGIENVICGENQTADVYNLQGIRVARQANAADVKALPAGIYVVNGQKVLVK